MCLFCHFIFRFQTCIKFYVNFHDLKPFLGSSVGSIDAEFRAPPSAFPAHLVRTDQMRRGKTGSLDSRTQVEYHQQVMNYHNHTRSNSDVILGNFNGSVVLLLLRSLLTVV